MRFSIYRYNPDTDSEPRMQAFELTETTPGMMLLDALLKLKQQDETLTFRHSCGEGVCGSDGMNINGRNGLSCITPLKDLKEPVEIRPLPGMPVIRDLVVDLRQFWHQYRSVKPWFLVFVFVFVVVFWLCLVVCVLFVGLFVCFFCVCCFFVCSSFWWFFV